MKPKRKLLNTILLLFCMVLTQGCEKEDPTVFSGEVIDFSTNNEIPGVTLLFSVYEKSPSFLTLPSIIREDTIRTDSQGHFRLVVPYNEKYSRFTINVLKEEVNNTFSYVNGETDCSPYDCSSFKAGNVYKFKLRIHLDSL